MAKMDDATSFVRKFIKVPALVLHDLRKAIADDSVPAVEKIFDSLLVEYEGVGIDTTPYSETEGSNSLYVPPYLHALLSSFSRRLCPLFPSTGTTSVWMDSTLAGINARCCSLQSSALHHRSSAGQFEPRMLIRP